MKRLDDLATSVDTIARDILTHAVKYNGRTVYVQGSYEDGMLSGMAGAGIKQDIELMILKTDLRAMPLASDRLVLPKVPNAMFKPTNVQNCPNGTHWMFNLIKVAV